MKEKGKELFEIVVLIRRYDKKNGNFIPGHDLINTFCFKNKILVSN